MAYQVIYRLQLLNFEEQNVTIHISDTTSGTGTPTYTELQPAEMETEVYSDNSSKYGIKGKRILFGFHPTTTENLNTFLAGDDNRWLVEKYVNGTKVFIGWLVVDDLKEAFLDPEVIVVEMSASDNLALLKDIPLRKPDDSVPKGKFKIIEYISWCLSKTNLDLPINIIWSLFPEQLTDTTNHAFAFIYLEAMSFETEIGAREDCYTVLKKLIPHCIISQENGEWWILRIDELNGDPLNVYHFDSDGTYTGTDTINPTKNIGFLDDINPINKDGEITPERKKKSTQVNVKYEFPREIICNIDFVRGDVILLIVITGGFAYEIECWTKGRNYIGSATTATVTPYIRRLFTNGYETERVVVFPTSATRANFIKSERVIVNTGDKFVFSVDRRLSQNIAGASGVYREDVAQIRLYGSNGTYWTLLGQDLGTAVAGDWVQTNSSFSTNTRTIQYTWNVATADEREWASVNVQAKPVPIGGEIEVYLIQSPVYGGTSETHFQNLRFDYIPLINGIYQKLVGHYHKVSTTDSLKAKVDEQVYLFDSPNANFKGSMFYFSGGNYILTTRWYDFNLGTGGALGLEKFGKYQAFELWNQHNRIVRRFQGSLLGLDTSTPNIPGLLHQYTLTATTDHTTNKIFGALSYSQNSRTCKWNGTFADVFDSADGKDYSSDHEFKYLT